MKLFRDKLGTLPKDMLGVPSATDERFSQRNSFVYNPVLQETLSSSFHFL